MMDDRTVSIFVRVFVILSVILFHAQGNDKVSMFDVVIGPVVHTVQPRFLSVAIGANLIKNNFRNFNMSSPALWNMISALSPAYLRAGGTSANLLIFEPDDSRCDSSYFTMTKSQWDSLNELASRCDVELIFDLNQLIRFSDHTWNYKNAYQLLNYTYFRGYKVGWELGNEPNSYKHQFNITLNATQSVADFTILHKFVRHFDPLKNSVVIGPDVTQPKHVCPEGENGAVTINSMSYLKDFLKLGGGEIVDAVTWHQYYVPSDGATESDFTNQTILDCLGVEIDIVKELVENYGKGKQIWLGETGSASGGGAPGLSDTFISTFMWLDKLGLSARKGVDVVIRQTLFKGAYALIDNYLFPRPDFWIALLHKELVGQRVLSVRLAPHQNTPPVDGKQGTSDCLRVYAHCTRADNPTPYTPVYPEGSVTVFLLSLCPHTVYLNMTTTSSAQNYHVYKLTSPDGNLTSPNINLNSKTLNLVNGETIPFLNPNIVGTGEVILVEPNSLAFIVLNHDKISECL